MADLTVVVTTFNGSAHLASTLNSLALQRNASLEVIVVDDGSTDDSARIAEAHRVGARVIRQENRGVAAARNRGLLEASAERVAFIDQDDLWHVDRAAALLELANDTGAKAVATTEQAFALSGDREALEKIGDERHQWPAHWVESDAEMEAMLANEIAEEGPVERISFERLLWAPASLTTALMYDRDAAIVAGGNATFLGSTADHFLTVCFARLFGDIPRVRRPLLFYRVHPDSITATSSKIVPYLATLLAMRYGGTMPPDPVRGEFVDDLLWHLHEAPIPRVEQAALLTLTTSPRDRPRRLARWAKRWLNDGRSSSPGEKLDV